jgi:deazaflavin-dependent oxidoreductase (nitroreductase family)
MALDPTIERALETDGIVDITTTGRKSGKPHRMETGLHRYKGQIYLSGLPGRRDWYANLLANPNLTIHLKQSTTADVPATVTPVEDPAEREAAIAHFVETWKVNAADRPRYLAESPLLTLHIEGFDQPR